MEKSSKIEDLLSKLLIVELLKLNTPQSKIKSIVGKSSDYVSQIAKSVNRGKDDE